MKVSKPVSYSISSNLKPTEDGGVEGSHYLNQSFPVLGVVSKELYKSTHSKATRNFM